MFQHKVLLLLFSLISSNLYAQFFNNDKLLDTSSAGLYNQSSGQIAADKNGNIGIVWFDNVYHAWDAQYLNFSTSTDHGLTFHKTLIDSAGIPSIEYYFFDPGIKYDKMGNLWILYKSSWEFFKTLHINKSTDGGLSFQNDHIEAGLSLYYSFCTDTLGNIHIVLDDNEALTYTKIKLGVLTDTANTFIFSTGSQNTPGINIISDPGGQNLYVLFLKWSKLVAIKSTDGGQTFSEPVKIDPGLNDAVEQKNPAAVFWRGKIAVSWQDDRTGENSLYYSESSDGITFTPALKVSMPGSEPYYAQHRMSGNSEMLGIIWGSYNTSADIFFSRKGIISDTFSVPARAGDINYSGYHQAPCDFVTDHQGYSYILMADNRLDTIDYTSRLFISIAKFTLTDLDDKQFSVNTFSLDQNYPNPFNPSTSISYSIPEYSEVVIKIFDILGNEIETIVNEKKTPGVYEVVWNAAGLPSGVYFYQLRADSFIHTKKMILLR